MSNKPIPAWESIHTLVFDFDGVLTNNRVWVDQNGQESVCCDRGDGLAFDLLRTFIQRNHWSLEYFLLSKEKNSVVQVRADKLKIKCYHGISNKLDYIRENLSQRFNRVENPNEGLVYLGNDLNDLAIMRYAGYSVAPCDAHSMIRQYASLVMQQKGGYGFVRAFIEKLLCIDQLDTVELVQLFE